MRELRAVLKFTLALACCSLLALPATAASASTSTSSDLAAGEVFGTFGHASEHGQVGVAEPRANLRPQSLPGTTPDVYPAPGGGNYNGGWAASYAESYAINDDTYYWPTIYQNDCTDFVSQALYAGNLTFVNYGAQGVDTWWSDGYGEASASWYFAPNLYSFLEADVPGGTYEGSEDYSTYVNEPYTPNIIVSGDVLMYNWSGGWNGNPDHVTIQVGIGSDNTGLYYGNLVDQHTPNQKHNIWTEIPENQYALTTTISFEHIWSSNP